MTTLHAAPTRPQPPPPLRGLSVVVPTFNESASIAAFLERTAQTLETVALETQTLETLAPESSAEPVGIVEIIVVDDDSPDGTADEAERCARRLAIEVRVLRRSPPRSLSRSVLDGARCARGDVLVVLDADLSHDPRDIPRLVDPVVRAAADVSIGSRYVSGGSTAGWSPRRRALSGLGTRCARLITRVRDPLSGFFALRRELLTGNAEVALRPVGFKILLEVLGRHAGLEVAEVPITFHERARGTSKFGARQGIEFLLQAFSLVAHRAIRRSLPPRDRGSRRPSRPSASIHNDSVLEIRS